MKIITSDVNALTKLIISGSLITDLEKIRLLRPKPDDESLGDNLAPLKHLCRWLSCLLDLYQAYADEACDGSSRLISTRHSSMKSSIHLKQTPTKNEMTVVEEETKQLEETILLSKK